MGSKHKVVNSEKSFNDLFLDIKSSYEKNKYLRVSYIIGVDRSLEQNRMFQELYSRIGKRLCGGDRDFATRECKLRFGVPICRRDYIGYAKRYDKFIKPFSYEEKLEIMFDWPVTRLFTLKQGQEYIDIIINTYAQAGVDFSELE